MYLWGALVYNKALEDPSYVLEIPKDAYYIWHSVKIWLAIQHSVKSTDGWYGKILIRRGT